MEKQKKKIPCKNHENINANYYCDICQMYICNKCENFHSNLFPNHKLFNLEKDDSNSFMELCEEEGHNMKLEYFCKSHNLLCCLKCISKIKTKNNGKHHDCEVCDAEEIKEEKKNKLNDNIKYLENLSVNLIESINKLEKSFEKINENKEELKIKIQKVFTKIKNEINNREDQLLLEVDNTFDNKYTNEEKLKEYHKLPAQIKYSLEKYNELNQKQFYNNPIILINYCLKIENNIEEVNIIQEKLINCNDFDNTPFIFYPDKEEDINDYLKKIQSFGSLINEQKEQKEFIKSSIIKSNYEQQQTIINWIKNKINRNKLELKLIFKMSENGSKSSDFHKYCDNKGPTLSLIKTTKNRKFGGFTPCDWKNSGNYVDDKTGASFIFSLDLNKKYDLINGNKQAIYCASNHGINFGCADLRLNQNLKDGISYANSQCRYLSNNNLELTGGKGDNEKFETEEFEVYQVIYV